jgi:hypothetical protein
MATLAQITSLFQNNPQALLYVGERSVTIITPDGQRLSYTVPSLEELDNLQRIKRTLDATWNLPEVSKAISLEEFIRADPNGTVSEDLIYNDAWTGDNLDEALTQYLQVKLGLTEAQVRRRFMGFLALPK